MNRIAIAKETIRITNSREYQFEDETIRLPAADYDSVVVITPEDAAALLSEPLPEPENTDPCLIRVTDEDSFSAAQRLQNAAVLNFANAHHAGGGFLLGATAQEEALCRCSTLYASIHSETASEMYRYNNSHIHATDSDYMLLSQNVSVFRDKDCQLLREPFRTAVITAPAPNRRGAAVLTSAAVLEKTFLRRSRIILRICIKYGYRNLVLGAWGCGAFGNDPKLVAGCFKKAIEEDNIRSYFANICFALYGSKTDVKYLTFKSILESGNETTA